MKKRGGFALTAAALTLAAAPIVGSAVSVQAAPKSGDAALPNNFGFANNNNSSGWSVSGTSPQTASGTGTTGVGFVGGGLTLNQVPNFDFGVHTIGTSETFPLISVDSGYRPQLLSAGATSANAGVRSLAVTDARQQMGKTTGYQVVLQLGPLQQATVNSQGQFLDITNQPTTDASKTQYRTDVAGNIYTLAGATLQLSAAAANPDANWNQFVSDTLDFNNKAALYPAYYRGASSNGIVQPGAMYTTTSRLAAQDAPTAGGVTISAGTGNAKVVLNAGLGKGFGTWAYDYTATSSATLKIPLTSQQVGSWVSQLTWVLVDDPSSSAAQKVIMGLH